jgi:hypothetical protein
VSIHELDDLINYLKKHNDEFGGSGWQDLLMGVTYWKNDSL